MTCFLFVKNGCDWLSSRTRYNCTHGSFRISLGVLFKNILTHGKKWFSYGNKIRDNFFFVTATKNFAAATKRFVDRTKHIVVVTKYFCCPYFNK